jgi:hypothetical protein
MVRQSVAPILVAGVLFLPTACVRSAPPEVRPSEGGTRSSASEPSPSSHPPPQPARVPPVDLASLRDVPARPAFGTPYPFDLYTHCGIELAQFAGANWRAERPFAGPLPGYIAGTLELLAEDHARFVIDKRQFDTSLEVIYYRKTAEPVPACK